MNIIEPLFTFKHNQQIKDGRSSTYADKQSRNIWASQRQIVNRKNKNKTAQKQKSK
jgi:hypothetical protein